MADLYSRDLFGKSKHDRAIERIRTFCAGKRVLCAFSGGKDSQCCFHLLQEAGVDFHAEYSITRFEPPELLRFIRQCYPEVTFRRAYRRSLTDDIISNGLPNMFARWCCEAKHAKTEGYDITVIGVRWAESTRRKARWRMFGFKPDRTAYLCPICDWIENDVWEYLASYDHCSLYDEGRRRIGCVCCPLAPPSQIMADVARWPRTARMLQKAAYGYVDRMESMDFMTMRGKRCADWCEAKNPHGEYWARWLATGQTQKPIAAYFEDRRGRHEDPAQCVFAGTGFSESDRGVLF